MSKSINDKIAYNIACDIHKVINGRPLTCEFIPLDDEYTTISINMREIPQKYILSDIPFHALIDAILVEGCIIGEIRDSMYSLIVCIFGDSQYVINYSGDHDRTSMEIFFTIREVKIPDDPLLVPIVTVNPRIDISSRIFDDKPFTSSIQPGHLEWFQLVSNQIINLSKPMEKNLSTVFSMILSKEDVLQLISDRKSFVVAIYWDIDAEEYSIVMVKYSRKRRRAPSHTHLVNERLPINKLMPVAAWNHRKERHSILVKGLSLIVSDMPLVLLDVVVSYLP